MSVCSDFIYRCISSNIHSYPAWFDINLFGFEFEPQLLQYALLAYLVVLIPSKHWKLLKKLVTIWGLSKCVLMHCIQFLSLTQCTLTISIFVACGGWVQFPLLGCLFMAVQPCSLTNIAFARKWVGSVHTPESPDSRRIRGRCHLELPVSIVVSRVLHRHAGYQEEYNGSVGFGTITSAQTEYKCLYLQRY